MALDLPRPRKKKNTRIIQDRKNPLTLVCGWVWGYVCVKAFSVFSLARKDLGGELVIIYNQVLERCFLMYGTEKTKIYMLEAKTGWFCVRAQHSEVVPAGSYSGSGCGGFLLLKAFKSAHYLLGRL